LKKKTLKKDAPLKINKTINVELKPPIGHCYVHIHELPTIHTSSNKVIILMIFKNYQNLLPFSISH